MNLITDIKIREESEAEVSRIKYEIMKVIPYGVNYANIIIALSEIQCDMAQLSLDSEDDLNVGRDIDFIKRILEYKDRVLK